MKPLFFIAALALAVTTGAEGGTAARAPLVIEDIEWSAERDFGSAIPAPHIRLVSRDTITSLSLDGDQGLAAAAAPGPEGEAVAFTVTREPGTLECRGSRAGRGASGTCRFTGLLAFEAALAARGIPLRERRKLLGLALVDAGTALVDELARAGYPIDNAADLMAVAALKVTADYARELEAAGLRPTALDKLVACRALAIDGKFLRSMAAAGYPTLSADEAIGLRAVGVTPEYAATMNRVVSAVRAVDGIGELQ